MILSSSDASGRTKYGKDAAYEPDEIHCVGLWHGEADTGLMPGLSANSGAGPAGDDEKGNDQGIADAVRCFSKKAFQPLSG